MSGSECELTGPQSGFKFVSGQKVFCFHGPVMYEAKCLKLEMRDGIPQYLIHYHGWNKNWDEWVPEDRVRDHTQENIKLASKLKDDQKNAPKEAKGTKRKSLGSNTSMSSTTSTPISAIKLESTETGVKQYGGKESSASKLSQSISVASPSNTTGGKVKEEPREQPATSTVKERRKRRSKLQMKLDATAAQDENARKLGHRVDIPTDLKVFLVDDFTIVQTKMVVNLAAAKSISQVLDDYVEERSKLYLNKEVTISMPLSTTEGKNVEEHHVKITAKCYERSCMMEVVEGLKDYFNEVLWSQLLYNAERQQYHQIMAKGKVKAEIVKPNEAKSQHLDPNASQHENKGPFRLRKNSNAKNIESAIEVASQVESIPADDGKPDLTKHYAPIHLLRMFSKINKFIASFSLKDPIAMAFLVTNLKDIVDYLNTNREQLFSPSLYVHPSTTEALVKSDPPQQVTLQTSTGRKVMEVKPMLVNA